MKTYSSPQQIVLSAIAALILCSGNSALLPFCPSSFPEPHSSPYKQWIVEVLGSVPRPGLYLFKHPPTPGEAIKKAGGKESQCGVIQGSQSSRRLPSGTTIQVTSRPSQRPILDSTDIHKSFIAGLPIDINKASAAELSLVPGISTTLAHRMVSYRDQHGHFTTWKEIDRVKGLGSATIKRVKNYLQLPAPLPLHSQ